MSESAIGLLQTSAEISVAFLGFASLVGVFLASTGGTRSQHARLVLRSLLDYGLLALLACAVPLLLNETSIDASTTWRISSGVSASFVVAYYLLSRSFYREVSQELRATGHAMSIALIIGDGLATLLLAFNAVGWPFGTSVALYVFAAVAWNVLGAAMSFRLVIDLAWSDDPE